MPQARASPEAKPALFGFKCWLGQMRGQLQRLQLFALHSTRREERALRLTAPARLRQALCRRTLPPRQPHVHRPILPRRRQRLPTPHRSHLLLAPAAGRPSQPSHFLHVLPSPPAAAACSCSAPPVHLPRGEHAVLQPSNTTLPRSRPQLLSRGAFCCCFWLLLFFSANHQGEQRERRLPRLRLSSSQGPPACQ